MLSPAGLQNSVSFIRNRGYGVIPDLFTPAEHSAASEELSRAELKRGRAGARHVLSLRSVCAIARRDELLWIARDVLGVDALPFLATFFDKSPALLGW